MVELNLRLWAHTCDAMIQVDDVIWRDGELYHIRGKVISCTSGRCKVGDPLGCRRDSENWGQIVLLQDSGYTSSSGEDLYEHDIFTDIYGDAMEVLLGPHSTSLDYYASAADGWYAHLVGGGDGAEEYSLAQTPCKGNVGGGALEVDRLGSIFENPLAKDQE